MNRKQKIAIAVGGIVVALLVLFVPYEVAPDEAPGITWWWIGRRPPTHEMRVQERVLVSVAPVLGRHRDPSEVEEPLPATWETRTKTVYGLPALRAVWIQVASITAALALTVAAVFATCPRVVGQV